MTFLLDASVSPYKRPLKIWDFVWEIQYWDRRTLNNVKSNFSFNGINKKVLPAIYSTVFRCLLVVLLVSLALLHNHCYSFIRRSQGWSLRSGNVLDQSQQKCLFFAEIQVRCKCFQLQPKRKTSFSSLRDWLEKSFIISPSNWTICAGLRGTSGFRPVSVSAVRLPTNLLYDNEHLHDGCKGGNDTFTRLLREDVSPWPVV